jgi:hypothetical protein
MLQLQTLEPPSILHQKGRSGDQKNARTHEFKLRNGELNPGLPGENGVCLPLHHIGSN